MVQGSHRLEKYLNLEGFLKKSLKIKYALKSTGKLHKGLEKAFNSSIFFVEINTDDRDLDQIKLLCLYLVQQNFNVAPNKGTTILY